MILPLEEWNWRRAIAECRGDVRSWVKGDVGEKEFDGGVADSDSNVGCLDWWCATIGDVVFDGAGRVVIGRFGGSRS